MPCYWYKVLLLPHPWVQFKTPTTITSATLLPDDNLQVLIHDCHKMKDGTRCAGAMVWAEARYSSPENNWPAWPRRSGRAKESPLPYTETVAMLYYNTCPQYHSMNDRERGLFIIAGERILKTKKNAKQWWHTHLIPTLTLYPFSFYSGTMRGFLLSAWFGFFLSFFHFSL